MQTTARWECIRWLCCSAALSVFRALRKGKAVAANKQIHVLSEKQCIGGCRWTDSPFSLSLSCLVDFLFPAGVSDYRRRKKPFSHPSYFLQLWQYDEQIDDKQSHSGVIQKGSDRMISCKQKSAPLREQNAGWFLLAAFNRMTRKYQMKNISPMWLGGMRIQR